MLLILATLYSAAIGSGARSVRRFIDILQFQRSFSTQPAYASVYFRTRSIGFTVSRALLRTRAAPPIYDCGVSPPRIVMPGYRHAITITPTP